MFSTHLNFFYNILEGHMVSIKFNINQIKRVTQKI